MVNSRDKGKRGEREWAKICRGMGYTEARRGQQYNGIDGEDVVGLPGLHVEVKWRQHLDINKAVEQALENAVPGSIPIIVHRKNGQKWLVTMLPEHWCKLRFTDADKINDSLNRNINPDIPGVTSITIETSKPMFYKRFSSMVILENTVPVLFTKKPESIWLITMRYTDWFVIYNKWVKKTIWFEYP